MRKWAQYLHGRTFCLVTDQRSVAFMLDPLKGTKIKNNKILLWRAELGTFSYRVEHTPGVDNVVPDVLSRPSGVTAALYQGDSLKSIHDILGHPGIRRLNHLIRQKITFHFRGSAAYLPWVQNLCWTETPILQTPRRNAYQGNSPLGENCCWF